MSLSTEDQEIYDKLTDWKQSEKYPQMEHSESGKLFHCPIHNRLFAPAQAANHARGCKSDSSNKKSVAERRKDDLENRLHEDEHGLSLVQTPEQMVLEDHNKEIAEAASMLAKDYELRAEFEMLHQQKIIPWDWTFYDWVKKSVEYWNGSFGFKLELLQDVSILSKEQIKWLHEVLSENLEHEKSKEDAII